MEASFILSFRIADTADTISWGGTKSKLFSSRFTMNVRGAEKFTMFMAFLKRKQLVFSGRHRGIEKSEEVYIVFVYIIGLHWIEHIRQVI